MAERRLRFVVERWPLDGACYFKLDMESEHMWLAVTDFWLCKEEAEALLSSLSPEGKVTIEWTEPPQSHYNRS